MATLGTPEEFLFGALGNNLGRSFGNVVGAAPRSLAEALVAGGRAAGDYFVQAGGQLATPSQTAYGQGGVVMPTFTFDDDRAAAGPQGKVDPRQALVTQRAMEDAEQRRAIIAARKWAAAAPSGGRNAIDYSFYQGLGLDTDLFNSPTGPYGQLQQAAVLTAPYRAQRQVAQIEAETARQANRDRTDTANRLIDAILSGRGGSGVPLTGVKTDYGAGVQLSPIFLRTNLARFRRSPARG